MFNIQRSRTAFGFASTVGLLAFTGTSLRSASPAGEWRAYNGDYASTRYSPLDQVNKDTIKNLKVVWRQSLTPDVISEGRTGVPRPSNNNETTPLMVGGLVYFSTGIGGVAALDAVTGKVVWHVDSLGSPTDSASGSKT